MELNFTSILILIVVIGLLATGVRSVPQGYEWVVERFGRYQRKLLPGLNLIIPYFDQIAYKVTTKDMVVDIEQQEVITSDNAVIHTNAVAFIKITDPVKAVYGVEDYLLGVRNLVQTSLRSIIGSMSLDEALSSRERIKAQLGDSLAEEMLDWGISLKSVEIQDIKPSPSMQQAMEQQAAAERERKAMVTKAEGAKQAAILEAEGRLESAKRDAKAEVTLAEASAQAIQLIRSSSGEDELPLTYLLGQRYVNALSTMAEGGNSKVILLPADLQETVRGLLSAQKSS